MRQWRTEQGLTLAELRDRVNAKLPPESHVELSSVSNFETPSKPLPRLDWLAGFRKAFPDVRLEWLLLGNPPETEGEYGRRMAGLKTLDEMAARGPDPWDAFLESVGGRTWMALSDLSLYLPSEVTAVATGLVQRWAGGRPDVLRTPPDVPTREEIRDYLERVLSPLMDMRFGSEGELIAAALGVLSAAFLHETGRRSRFLDEPAPLRRMLVEELQASLKKEKGESDG